MKTTDDIRERILENQIAIDHCFTDAVATAADCGHALLLAGDRLGANEWAAFVVRRCGLSLRRANVYMAIARSMNGSVRDLSPSATAALLKQIAEA
jgi:hypothetical protein